MPQDMPGDRDGWSQRQGTVVMVHSWGRGQGLWQARGPHIGVPRVTPQKLEGLRRGPSRGWVTGTVTVLPPRPGVEKPQHLPVCETLSFLENVAVNSSACHLGAVDATCAR